MGVALENDFIPVGMEQFHAAPTSQWNVITKMIDECDFYLLVIGGRYGSIDEETGKSYTEKEYDYAKGKGLPVLVLIKEESVITENKKDTGENKYSKMEKLDAFRAKVKNDGNTVDFFTDLNSLRYVASPTLGKAVDYADDNAGWVRYRDVVDIINEEAAWKKIFYGNPTYTDKGYKWQWGKYTSTLINDYESVLSVCRHRTESIGWNSDGEYSSNCYIFV